jgi:hypothetical protein
MGINKDIFYWRKDVSKAKKMEIGSKRCEITNLWH